MTTNTDLRIEAAAKAIEDGDPRITSGDALDLATDALAAADAVDPLRNPSDADIEKVRAEIHHHLSPVIGWMALNSKDREKVEKHVEAFNERAELAVHAVVAALRGEA